MKYTNESDKQKIRNALKVFLVQHNNNLQGLVNLTDKTYNQVYAKIYQGHIEHDYVNELVKLVNPSAKLEKFSNTFMITFKTNESK
jgi:hypothetical protein